MKKLLVTTVVAALTLACVQAQAADKKKDNSNNNNNNGVVGALQGYYANFGLGLTHNNDGKDTNFGGFVGVGNWIPTAIGPFTHAILGWEGDFQFYGDGIYGINGDGMLGYQVTGPVSVYVKAGALLAHAGHFRTGLQTGVGAGYTFMNNMRTSFEIMHTYSVLGGMTAYNVGFQYLMG